jgi:hypothetical protein
VADIGLSILDIWNLKNCKGLFFKDDWLETQPFAKHTDQPSWRLIRRTPVENSFNKTWNEQQALLDPQTDEVPLARQFVYIVVLYFLTTKKRLFEICRVRINDVDSSGKRIFVGAFDEDSLDIGYWNDDALDNELGVASARKAENIDHPTSSLTP